MSTITIKSNASHLRQPATIVDMLRRRAATEPQRVAFSFLLEQDQTASESPALADNPDSDLVSLSFSELDRQARTIAAGLLRLVGAGERVLLIFPSGLDYIASFFGCLYAGVVAVPAYPPRRNRSLIRLQEIVADAQATVALTTPGVLGRVAPQLSQNPYLQALRWLTPEALLAEPADPQWEPPAITSESLAFLQYTSGSTSMPKGVMVTHGNLWHNEEAIKQAFAQDQQSVIVGWLPLHHDMGLIGNVLQTVYSGAHCVLMSPMTFLRRPVQWLEALTRFRATTSGGPNFAYELCARKVRAEERQRLDLSNWRVAYNGAEPVRPETMDRFATAFAECGFRREAFQPCYGLAEATLLVAGRRHVAADGPRLLNVDARALTEGRIRIATDEPDTARRLVSCGVGVLGQQMLIVDPRELRPCASGQVGELWVAGASVASGYWNRSEQTAETFAAQIECAEETPAGLVGPYLRTGDLGFIHEGELYVTGRLKDLLILRGRNLYPQDIEATVESCDETLRVGCGAAFTVEAAGEERLVIVQEVRGHLTDDQAARIMDQIRLAVAEEHEAAVEAIVLLKAGSIPKTTSGKVQRGACRAGYEQRSLSVVAQWRASEDSAAVPEIETGLESAETRLEVEQVEQWLVQQLSRRSDVSAVELSPERGLTSFGVDSLGAVELGHQIEMQFGVRIGIERLLESVSLREIAALVAAQASEGHSEQTVKAAAAVAGEVANVELAKMSHGQQAIWFLQELAPDSAAYHVVSALRLRSGVKLETLRRVFQALVDRHPQLRTTFTTVGGEPVQQIQQQLEVSIAEEDAGEWSAAELEDRLGAEARRKFSLAEGPLMRVKLYRRNAEGVLLVVLHHIVVDLWSLGVLMQELGVLYEAELEGAVAQLAPLPVSYRDYVKWQEEMLASEEGERQRKYWEAQLADCAPVLNLPTDRPRPPLQSYQGAAQSLRLNGPLVEKLKTIGRAHGATLYMTLLAAFEVLLHRYTNQTDILIGSPATGRNWSALSGIVGYFVNPLVLRARLSGNLTFEEFLEQVRQTVLAAFKHQDYPFSMLVESLQPERDPSLSPLFQVMFVWQKSQLRNQHDFAPFAIAETGARANLGGLVVEAMSLDQQVAQFDMTLMMTEVSEGLVASLQYNTDLFEEATIKRFLQHFEKLLVGVAAAPATQLHRLALLSSDERRQLLVEWNETAAPVRESCIQQLFEEQVTRTPAAVAVADEAEQLSYAELNERANQLAHHLRGLGVGPEVLVGLCLERSVAMVVSVLAVLKAGGAYVPLDPAYPRERLAFMLADAAVSVLLTESPLLAALPVTEKLRVVCVDEERAVIAAQRRDNPASGVGPDNLAYVIYTSGSTGRPKGVMLAHRGLCNLSAAQQASFGVRAGQRVLQFASLSFDASVWEMFMALTAGATLWVADRERLLSGGLAQGLNEREIDVVTLPPSVLGSVAAEAELATETIIVAGESCPAELARRWGGGHRFFNAYGPTETTVCATMARCEGAEDQGPSIGRPIRNLQAYVVDGGQEVPPVGVFGELCVGGVGLARGYWQRPELTAEKFVPDPFGATPGGRLYRTGDLVRYLANGEIEYVGRIDEQVKLRGYRIELGEIEAALTDQEGIREAMVIVRAEATETQRLVAYVVTDGGVEVKADELRQSLRAKLPEYMVPGAFVTVAEWPLTPNGKVDRRALPAPESNSGKEYVGPRTPVEEMLAGIYREVLGLAQVSIDENFFELGGHSLLATQVVSRVRESFGVELALLKLFESPTVAGLSREVMAAMNESSESLAPPLRAVERVGPAPLSFAQQRLWFLDQLEPGSAFYNSPLAVRLSGVLNLTAFEQTLSEIVRRHESLRTRFVSVDGQPRQVIDAAQTISLNPIELSELAESEREIEARRLAKAEAEQPFDLSTGPLLRVQLLRLAEEDHVVLFTMHHIISDGWSLGVLVKEVATLYEAYIEGEQSPLPELELQYADYAAWQREWLQGEVLEEQLSYWQRQLGGELPVLELPTDRPRPAVQSYRGARELLTLSAELTQQLKALSQREGCTLFMTLLAAFQVLLSRYTGQEDVVVGTAIAGRNRAEVEPLIGFFVNTLALRTDVSGDPSFIELLRRVREVTLGAYAHQDIPFEKLVEELQPERDLSRAPLVNVMLVLQNAPLGRLEIPGLTLRRLEDENEAAKLDLIAWMVETTNGLHTTFEYNTDLFEPATVKRLLSHFEALLSGVLSAPEQRVSRLPLLSPDEFHQLIYHWNETGAAVREGCIQQLFEEQAARTPAAVAVTDEAEQLSYAGLNERANQLAHHLRGLGVGPEVLVGLCLERSAEMVVSVLAVLKAGGAYVPLDPAYPRERLAFMLADAGVSVLLTQTRLLAVLPVMEKLRVVCVDEDRQLIAAQRRDNPASGVGPDNLAYVIYTSGSTGRPKGVQISHRALLNFLTSMQQTPGISAADTLLSVTTLSFDIAGLEIYLPLLNGARLVLASRETALDGRQLARLIESSAATIMQATPATWRLLLEAQWQGNQQLKLWCGGEALPAELATRLQQHGASLWNLYGPTETTIWSTLKQVRTVNHALVEIGRPIANTQLFVLNSSLQPVPPGVASELFIGGDGLARGYYNRPELTAERFLPDPFAVTGGARLYRTGDLVRYLPDGELEFVGRMDQQVKLRGYRIELGEIEAALMDHAAVREAVVIVRVEEPRLMGYVVTEAGVKVEDLRQALRAKLPEYMVPSALMVLAALPLTANGKLDRRALPAPEVPASGEDAGPRTPIEELLAGVYGEVLGLGEVGVAKNFFELGGHSLLATRLISKIREAFQIEIPLRRVFESPTVAGMAAIIERELGAGASSTAPPIRVVERDEKLPLSFAQQRLWFLDQLEAGSALYNIPLAVRLTGALNLAALEQTLSEIVRRHESLRTRFVSVAGQPQQVIDEAVPLQLAVIELSGLAESEREAATRRLAKTEAEQPFDLAQGPLLRVQLLRLADEEHVVLFTMHHIISDGWSLGVLVREVAILYDAYIKGEESPLPELAVQYADYAAWQRAWLQGEVLEDQLSYWRRQLSGELPVLELPADRPRPAVQSYRGARESITLSAELTQQLKALSQREGCTLFMTLLAAFQVLLHRYTRQDDIVVGTVVAGRTRVEVEPLIGLFINSLVLRTDLSGDPSFRELLRRVREVTLGAYAHQDVPFEKLVEELQPERAAGRAPLFQVAFGLQNAPLDELRLGETQLSVMEFEQEAVRFDLTVWLMERDGVLSGVWTYSGELFEVETIARMQRHYAQLLQSIVAGPVTRISNLDYLTSSEKQRQSIKETEQEEASLVKLMAARRKSVTVTQQA